MYAKAAVIVTLAVLLASLPSSAQDQPRTGTTIGKVQGQKNTPDGKNTFIDILAPGEEKARAYHVIYDAKIKGPVPQILTDVRHAKVGDVVEVEWVFTNHGPAIKSFKTVRKAGAVPKDK